jgi:hypothetical protein
MIDISIDAMIDALIVPKEMFGKFRWILAHRQATAYSSEEFCQTSQVITLDNQRFD